MYQIEIFDDQMQYEDAALISDDQSIELDYLTFDAYTITTPVLNCKKGYFIHITRDEVAIDGIVSDVQPAENSMQVSIRPLQALFDVDVFSSPINDVIDWLRVQIQNEFINNSDTLQNRPVKLAATPTREAHPLSIEGETVNLIEVISKALITYGIVCECRIDLSDFKIDVHIFNETSSVTLEADLPNVLEKSITLGDSYGAANKIVIRKIGEDAEGNEAPMGQAIFYLHPDGTVNAMDEDRITPVFWVLQDLKNSETWDEEALKNAIEALQPQQFDNEIVLTYRLADKIAHPQQIPIGAQAKIWTGNIQYNSILTGKTILNGTVELVFGQVRAALTKRLILERRS